MHVALEHPPVERVLRVTPHEKRAHGAHQLLQWPDARPLADRVGERGLFGGEKCGQHIVHVRAVIHHKHHRRLGIDLAEPLVVSKTDAHPVQQPRKALRQPIAHTEINVCVERRDNLARVAQHFGLRHGTRHIVLGGVDLHRLDHFCVVSEAVDKHLALGELERANRDVKTGVNLVDHTVNAPAQQPAGARHQHSLSQRPDREGQQDHEKPQRQHDRSRHDCFILIGSVQASGDTLISSQGRTGRGRLFFNP